MFFLSRNIFRYARFIVLLDLLVLFIWGSPSYWFMRVIFWLDQCSGVTSIPWWMLILAGIMSDHICYFWYHNTDEYQNDDMMHLLFCFLISQFLAYNIRKGRYKRITLYDTQDECFVFFRKCQIHDYRNDVITLNVHD